MPVNTVVLRDDDERCLSFIDDGWTVTARSWAARLEVTSELSQRWRDTLVRLSPRHTCRELQDADVPAVLGLDASTASDYPSGMATAHEHLTAAGASPSAGRRGFGVFDCKASLVAMTFVDVDDNCAEVVFTVVAQHRRGGGLSTTVKAASLLALVRDGVTLVRTGGSEGNHRILAANVALGFQVDEYWLTLSAPLTG